MGNNQSLLKNLLQQLSDAIAIIEVIDEKALYTYFNPTMKRVYGELENCFLADIYCEKKYTPLWKTLKEADSSPKQLVNGSDAENAPYYVDYKIQSIKRGSVYLLFIKMDAGTAFDLLEKKERELSESESRYESLVETSPDAVFVHDEKDQIVYVNQSGLRMIGAERKTDLLGKDIKSFVHNESAQSVRDRIAILLAGGFVKGPIERQMKRLDGSVIDVEVHGSVVKYQEVKAVQSICRNISERRKQQEQLEEMAFYDQLTQVPNRRSFFEKLEKEWKRVEEQKSILALLFFDLDNFKQINDRYGHQVGDELLVIFTKRLNQGLRKSDTLSRLGGDEFVILLTDLNSVDHPRLVADRMLDRVLQPIHLQGSEIEISVSIGVSIYPEHGTSQGDLLTKADRALYVAKENGRRSVSVYSPE
ncbi:diguanylate cyclase domain-containing protein [Halobacillus dabanensis]|uniref:diguanylate cyclase domain-containing protein n=1 Tax=Halobacillus dabanensis TaxID=240302 RepID=UPI001428B152|nr:diguanylate cyclase [Halobacillus dabanensis]